MKNTNWKKYGFEFLSIFIAVLSAFALNNWSDNRRDNNAENKILTEIANGLKQDINDIRENKGGHHFSIRACVFWRNIIEDTGVDMDSLAMYYFELDRKSVV